MFKPSLVTMAETFDTLTHERYHNGRNGYGDAHKLIHNQADQAAGFSQSNCDHLCLSGITVPCLVKYISV